MKRGDSVTIALQGDFGKPRPALVIQSDLFEENATVTVLLLTNTLIDAPLPRVTVQPGAVNGPRAASQVMIDKTLTAVREKAGKPFGRLDSNAMLETGRRVAHFLGIAR